VPACLDHRPGELEHVDRVSVVDEVRLAGCRSTGHQVFRGQDEAVNQVVYVGVIELDVLAADQHLDMAG
jgi:hypothetical protein